MQLVPAKVQPVLKHFWPEQSSQRLVVSVFSPPPSSLRAQRAYHASTLPTPFHLLSAHSPGSPGSALWIPRDMLAGTRSVVTSRWLLLPLSRVSRVSRLNPPSLSYNDG